MDDTETDTPQVELIDLTDLYEECTGETVSEETNIWEKLSKEGADENKSAKTGTLSNKRRKPRKRDALRNQGRQNRNKDSDEHKVSQILQREKEEETPAETSSAYEKLRSKEILVGLTKQTEEKNVEKEDQAEGKNVKIEQDQAEEKNVKIDEKEDQAEKKNVKIEKKDKPDGIDWYLDKVRGIKIVDGKLNIGELEINTATQKNFVRFCVKCKNNAGDRRRQRENETETIILKPANEKKLREGLEEVIRFALHDQTLEGMMSRMEREPVMKSSLEFLESEFIFPLKKKSARFTDAVYFCRLCDYHISSVMQGRNHSKHPDHVKAKTDHSMLQTLRLIPPPSDNHIRALSQLVENTALEFGRQAKDFAEIKATQESLTKLLQNNMNKACFVRVYGSSQSGTALQESDVNLEVVFPENQMTHAEALFTFHRLLLHYPHAFQDVEIETNNRWPFVSFAVKLGPHLRYVASVRNWQAFEVNRLIAVYTINCEPLRLLAQVLRKWSKMCKLDDYSTGGLPAYVFDLMLIHYLQKMDPPMLPVLQEVQPVEPNSNELYKDFPAYQTDKTLVEEAFEKLKGNWKSLGELWLGFFRFYCIEHDNQGAVIQIRTSKTVSREEKGWNRKKIAIEDPFLPKKNFSQMRNEMFEYFTHCFHLSYKYFGIPFTESGPLFSYYDGILTFTSRMMEKKRLQEEARRSRQLSERISEEDCIELPDDVPNDDFVSKTEQLSLVETPASREKDIKGARNNEEQINPNVAAFMASTLSANGMSHPRNFSQLFGERRELSSLLASYENNTGEIAADKPNVAELVTAAAKLERDEFLFEFRNVENFTGGKAPITNCNYCGQEGHKGVQCPEKMLPPLVNLVPVTNEFLGMLNMFFHHFEKTYMMGPSRYLRQGDFINRLTVYLRQTLRNDVQLCLFGSSQNGFGFLSSDLDICLTFQGHPTLPDDVDQVTFIKAIGKCLVKCRGEFRNILPVTQAKVPIVKFFSNMMQLEGDISLYNVLAMRNTCMLRTYAEMDSRVRQLGFVVKMFAKICDIGDASRGSLSSYAYVIMMLHYLQRCQPPVIPVLQELGRNLRPGNFIVDGWDTYFWDDIRALPKVWPSYGQNRKSVPELWIGFLRYFTETFRFDADVIQIRRSERLTKFEKLWTEKPLALEDPFDLSHNLGAGLSKKMFNYIQRCFHRSRTIFGSNDTLKAIIRHSQAAMTEVTPEFLFHYLSRIMPLEEELPKDRVCRLCERVGHFVENCPWKKKNRQRLLEDGEQEAKRAQANTSNNVGGVTRPAPGAHQNKLRIERRDAMLQDAMASKEGSKGGNAYSERKAAGFDSRSKRRDKQQVYVQKRIEKKQEMMRQVKQPPVDKPSPAKTVADRLRNMSSSPPTTKKAIDEKQKMPNNEAEAAAAEPITSVPQKKGDLSHEILDNMKH